MKLSMWRRHMLARLRTHGKAMETQWNWACHAVTCSGAGDMAPGAMSPKLKSIEKLRKKRRKINEKNVENECKNNEKALKNQCKNNEK